MSDGPLAGIRVVDLTGFLAGPYATLILGDLGAEVIKVEGPDGDLTRKLPPHFVDGDSGYFLSTNRNKRSIIVDLKSQPGQQVVKELIAVSDIVIENFRPGVTSRLGLDREDLMAGDTRLVWCSISGFGQSGPYRDLPAYDMVIQALSGGMSMTGEVGGPPVRTGVPLSDLNAGMFAVIGILAAMQERARTGKGQYIDISMLDCQISMLSYQAVYTLISGMAPGRQGRGHASIPTYRVFEADQGTELVVTANTERMWRGVCAVLNLDALVDDPRFANNADRYNNREELWRLLEGRFATKSAAEWMSELQAVGVPVAVVNTVDEALADPQVLHRNMILTARARNGESIKLIGDPIKMSRGRDPGTFSFPPALGQDTTDILANVIGKSHDEIATLIAGRSVVSR